MYCLIIYSVYLHEYVLIMHYSMIVTLNILVYLVNVLSHYLQGERVRLDKVYPDWYWVGVAHLMWYNTPQELEELQRQLQGATDENIKKQLQQEISITKAKRDIAEAKEVR